MLLAFKFLFLFIESNAAEKPGIIKDLDGGYSSETIKNYLFPVSKWHNREGTSRYSDLIISIPPIGGIDPCH
jgi:hypothetical protein